MSQPAQQAAVQRRAANAAVQQPAVQQPQVSATADYVKKMSAQWAKVLPTVCTPERFARVALSCLNGNQKLAAALQTQTGMVSLSSALMKCAEVGLEPNGRDAHLIPFNTKQGVQIQLIIDYKGLVKLARRSGEISTIVAETVHKSDKFQFSYTEGVICHEPNFDVADPGEAYAWYVKVTFKDGSTQTKMMRKFQIEEIRKRSRSANDGPWVTDYDAMALKGLAVDTPILTTEGWKNMGDLQKGDMVFDMNGKPTPIIAVSEIKHLPCYKITTSNSEEIICDNEHRWIGWIGRNRRNKPWKELTTMELIAAKNEKKTVAIPVTKHLDTEHIDQMPKGTAYLLGYWIGNGHSRGATVSCHKDDVEHLKNMINDSCYSLGAIRYDTRSNAVCVSIKNGFREYLVKNNQWENKHIPDDVLFWNSQDKQDFLAGLIDSDGTINKARGRVVFNTTKKDIAYGVYSLIYSLGEVANIHEQTCHGYGKTVQCYYIGFQPSQSLKPTRMERKLQLLKPRQVSLYRSIKSIEEVESVPTKCIAVESETHSYLAGKTLIPTHNTVFKQVSKWLPNESEKFDEVNKAIQYDNEDERGPIDVTPRNSRFAGNAQQAPAGGLLGALGGQQPVVQTAEAQNVPQNDAANVQPQQPQQQAAPQDPDAEINARLAAAKAPVSYNDIREWYEVENGRWDANDVLANLDACISKALDFKDSANQPQ